MWRWRHWPASGGRGFLGRGWVWSVLVKTTQDAAPAPIFQRRNQGPKWRSVFSRSHHNLETSHLFLSTLLLPCPCFCVFLFFWFFCYLTYVSCPRSQETLLCVITGFVGQPTWVQSPVLSPPGCVIQQGSLSVLEPSSLPGKQD